jgi:hypothetical protein
MSHRAAMPAMGQLTQDQEMIAQFMMTQPHSGGIHSANYRKMAHEENVRRLTERSDQVTALRSDLGKSVSIIAADLRTEINSGCQVANTGIKAVSDNLKLLAESHEGVKNDIAFARHELNRVGEQITSLNHLVTNRNKEILIRIEDLERQMSVLLKAPPPQKVHWIELLVTVGTVLLAMGVLYLQNKPTLPMIGY